MSTSHKVSEIQYRGDVYTSSSSLNMLLPFLCCWTWHALSVSSVGSLVSLISLYKSPWFTDTSHVGPLLEVEDNRDSKSLSDCYLKWLMFLPQISLKNTTAWSVSYYEHSVLFMYNPYVHKIYIYNRFCVVSLIARLLRKLLNFHFGTVLHVCNGHCLMQLNPNTKPYVNHSMLYVTCCIIQ